MATGEESACVTIWAGRSCVRCRHITGYLGCYRLVQSSHGGEVEGEEQHASHGQPWPYRFCQELEWRRSVTRFLGPEVAVSKRSVDLNARRRTHLTNEHGTAEQDLFRQLAHGALGIFLRTKLHNSKQRLRSGLPRLDEIDLPTPLRNASGSDENFGE